MSRLLKITDLGSGIMVQGTDNVLYPDNATLTYPYNSIVVVTDESDIATFRSASNNDVLFSGLIGKIEIGGEIVTKQNINAKFDAIANQESGGGDVTGLFADASYDSQTKHINFYDKDNTLVAYVDATDFIKDGMVSNVEIVNGNLVITFNTDAGKEPITIPLTDIFNPNNYYTKTDANSLFATQVVVNEEIAARIAGDNAINTALGAKADKSDTYTKNEVDTALSAKVSQSEFDTKEEVISTALVDLDENKQDKLTAGQNITIQNNVISSTSEPQVQSDWNQTDSTAVDYIRNKPDTSEFVTKTEYNPKEKAIAEALTDLNENKADASDVYTKNQTDTAISTAIGQIDLSDYQTKADADIKEEVISTALNELEDNKADKATTYTKTQVDALIPVVPTNVSAFTNDAGYLTQHQSLSNYYTKTQSDSKYALKFTDVDDIQKVSALPANPDSKTLYLIPVQ